MSNVFELKNENEFKEFYKKNGTQIFVFTADWCPDCLFIKSFMPELHEKYADYNFIYVNRDQFVELCQSMDIMGIPSFIKVRDGQGIDRFVSRLRKTKPQIDAFLAD